MAESITFPELGAVGELSSSAIVAIVQNQGGELVSLKATVAQIAQYIVDGIEFSGLTSEDKKIIGAINEVITKVGDLNTILSGGTVGLTIIENSYVETNGTITPYNGWSRTDYFDVGGKTEIKYSFGGVSEYCCYYDADKVFISSFSILNTTNGSVPVPANAKYAIVSTTNKLIQNFVWKNNTSGGLVSEVLGLKTAVDDLEKVEVKELQASSLIGQTGSNRETIIGNHIYYHLGFSARQVIPAGTVLFTGTPHKMDSKNIAWTTYLGDVATFDFNKNGTITNALQIAQGKAFFIDFVVV